MIRRASSDWTIVFDLDDTLYQEADFVRSGFAAVDSELIRQGVSGFNSQAIRLFEQGQRQTIFDQALSSLGLNPDPGLIAELVQVYRSHFPKLQLFPDAERALNRYATTARVGLLTDGFAATQRNKVRALNIEERFSAVVYSDDFGRDCWKPSLVPFQKVSELLAGNAAERFVYVADNPKKDFIAPNQLGWCTIRVRRPLGEYSQLEAQVESAGAQFVVSSLDELPGILRY